MKRFRNLTIAGKVTLMMLTTSVIAISVVAGGLFPYELARFKRHLESELRTVGIILERTAAPSAADGDWKRVSSVLLALANKPEISGAAVYDPQAALVARYGSVNGLPSEFKAAQEDLETGPAIWRYARPIVFEGATVGTIVIRADYARVRNELIRPFFATAAAVLLASLVLIWQLTSRIQKLVTQPIQSLASLTQRVAREHDYTARAAADSGDELGELACCFNEMLGRIQAQEETLLETDRALRQKLEALQHEVEERLSAEAALAASEARFRGVVERLGEGILLVNLKGSIQFCNPRITQLTGRTEEELLGRNVYDFVVQAEETHRLARVAAVQSAPDHVVFEGFLLHSDGQKIPTEMRVSDMRGAGGEVLGKLATFVDISERKLAEQELVSLNEKLIKSSRLAGMAEIATGVLHNVGNVLNSVNIAASMAADRLRKSKVSSLSRTTELLKHKNGELADFLNTDEQGKRIPAYLWKLSEHLVEENHLVLKELELLGKNVEHIKEIVAVQQNYAAAGGVVECVDAEKLVEDALQIHSASFAQHSIRIVRDFKPCPKLRVDRHKTIQILVNLLRNAKQAMDDMPGHEKRIVVSLKAAGTFVRIVVKDNGGGIAPENLTRIFQHGFTTKKNGHGFGLHSGALAAKEMGGQISAASDGLGMGATFTLELPSEVGEC